MPCPPFPGRAGWWMQSKPWRWDPAHSEGPGTRAAAGGMATKVSPSPGLEKASGKQRSTGWGQPPASIPIGRVHVLPLNTDVLCLATQPCSKLYTPIDCSLPGSSAHGDFPGKNTGGSCHAFLQRIFPIQESNQSLLHCSTFFTSWATRKAHSLQILLLITTANICQFTLARYSAKYNWFNSQNNPMIL